MPPTGATVSGRKADDVHLRTHIGAHFDFLDFSVKIEVRFGSRETASPHGGGYRLIQKKTPIPSKKKMNYSSETKKAAPRGRSFAVGNKAAAKPKELHRVTFNASVAPETLARLRELSAERGLSVGKLIDAAVKLL